MKAHIILKIRSLNNQNSNCISHLLQIESLNAGRFHLNGPLSHQIQVYLNFSSVMVDRASLVVSQGVDVGVEDDLLVEWLLLEVQYDPYPTCMKGSMRLKMSHTSTILM